MFAAVVETDAARASPGGASMGTRQAFPSGPVERIRAEGAGLAMDGWVLGAAPAAHAARCDETGLAVVAWARLDCPVPVPDPAAALLAAWRAQGDAELARLRGDFAFVAFDPARGHVFAARDPLGIRPLYYRCEAGRLGIATSLPALESLYDPLFTIDEGWVAGFVAGVSMSVADTCFAGVRKLAPGHVLAWRGGEPVLSAWHRFDPEAPRADRPDPVRVAAYREALDRAVARHLPPVGRVAYEASGGLDSATLVAMGAALRDPEAVARELLAIGIVSQTDEPGAILESTQAAGIVDTHLLVCPQRHLRAGAARHVARVLGHPAEHAIAVIHEPVHRMAARLGAARVVSGFGGDEAVTAYGINQHRDLASTGQFAALWQALPGHPLMRAARMAKQRLRGPRAFRDPAMARAALALRTALLPLDGDLRAHQAARIAQASSYGEDHATMNGLAIDMLTRPFVSTRTESGTLVAASFGLDHVWPLLDVDLVACWLASPAVEKARPGMGRWLHRRAVAGVVPEAIRLRRLKALGAPLPGSGPASPARRWAEIAECATGAAAGPLARVLDPQRLAALVAIAAKADAEGLPLRVRLGDPRLRHAQQALTAIDDLATWILEDRPRA